jgi:hypothetical protein
VSVAVFFNRTHLKASYLRRNGLPATANRTFTEHWMKHGG